VEIAGPVEKLPKKDFRTRQIGIRLDYGPTDYVPTSSDDHFANSVESLRVVFLDMPVNRGFPTNEGQFRIGIHQVEKSTAGNHSFVESFTPVPQPDRIKMGIRNQVKSVLHAPRFAETDKDAFLNRQQYRFLDVSISNTKETG